MRHNILLPTDFSKNSWHAITYALKLYESEECHFYILNAFSVLNNIIDSIINIQPRSVLYETAKYNSNSELARVLDMLAISQNYNPKHHFKTISTCNNVVDAIKDFVERENIELIVMGTKDETTSKSKVYGSKALNVLKKVRICPLIIIPNTIKYNQPKEIVLPTNYETGLKKIELNQLKELAKKCNATIKILHVSSGEKLNSKQLKNKQLLEAHFRDVKYAFHSLSKMDIPTAIKRILKKKENAMVVLTNKNTALFTIPLVKGIRYNSKVPLLVMPDLRN
jgi:nucleotide-binding universal stress UspA family protein